MQRARWQISFFLFIFVMVFVAAGVAQAETFRCTLQDVVVFPERIHCQCTTTTPDGSSNIRYFAVATANSTIANRLMSLCMTSLVSGRRFIADYTKGDVSGSGFNCQPGDCRKLNFFGIE